jgi:hypothetical protein
LEKGNFDSSKKKILTVLKGPPRKNPKANDLPKELISLSKTDLPLLPKQIQLTNWKI